MNVTRENSMLTVSSNVDDNNLLRRCLVGKFCGERDAPIRNEVRRWAQQTSKGAHNIQVYNMNGYLFLFEFQTIRMVEHVIKGKWKRQGLTVKLEWWSPTIGVIPDEKGPLGVLRVMSGLGCTLDRDNRGQPKLWRNLWKSPSPTQGLHISWNKIFLYPVNEVPNLTSLAWILGGSNGELPTVYLVMSLGDQNRSIDIRNGVVEKCEKRLVKWKSQYLSLGGRLTLINSVLDSMPTYIISLFPISDGVIERLDVLRRNFLSEGNSETKKFHLVKWDALIGSKQKGGTGVRILETQNQCLMMKWLWRFASSKLALWKEIIQLKYEMTDLWITKITYGINLWKSIKNLWPKLRENCIIRKEDGRKVLSGKTIGSNKLPQRIPSMTFTS
ncbi:hypothetical protein MTR67_039306 [Solanum verrucosum]|uniref:DUF4283 domain-containing protein n=1 Tax=Solanum verrucosum TaxID=315347 RepID=A0AAF0UHU2_SOLVR|nr:hypothetical protein MTR67_039306 [Solanum verrucosum]